MSEESNVIKSQSDAELERYFSTLKAFRAPAPPEAEPAVRWTARDLRLFVGTFAILAAALGVGMLLGRMF